MDQPRIRTLLLRVFVRFAGDDDSDGTSEVVRYLSDSATRLTVYKCCVDLMKDPTTRTNAALFLLTYVVSFPVSHEDVLNIQKCCVVYEKQNPFCRCLVREVLPGSIRQPFEFLLHHTTTREAPLLRANDISPNPTYVGKFALQTPIALIEAESEMAPIAMTPFPSEECAGVATSRNRTLMPKLTAATELPPFTGADYIHQFPMDCSEEEVDERIATLGHFCDRYRHNSGVQQATAFLIKLMCDGYVSKIPLGAPYSFFRSVSICYLPTLLEWMKSDYLCVRNHVYDFLLTLSVHLQLVDTQGLYPGCTEALQNELLWLLLNVLQRQALLKAYDEMTWTAAAKCTLAVVPPAYRHLIDCRALLQFLQLPRLAELFPEVFTTFAAAFSRSVLADKRLLVRPADNLVLDRSEFTKLGSTALCDILELYRRSTTVGARLAFFHILFACAAERMKESESLVDMTSALQECFTTLVSVDFFWYLHPLLFHQSDHVRNELPSQIINDLDFKMLRYHRTVFVPLLQHLLHIIEDDATVQQALPHMTPPALGTSSHGARGTVSASRQAIAMATAAGEAAAAVPLLLKENTEIRLHNLAWRISVSCMTGSMEHLRTKERRAAIKSFLTQLTGPSDGSSSQGRSTVCLCVLSSLAMMSRTQPHTVLYCFDALLDRYIFAENRKLSISSWMRLYTLLMECITLRNGPVSRATPTADVSSLMLTEGLVGLTQTARGASARVLWAVYRGLRQDQSAAVCRARHVLISLLAQLDTVSTVRAWRTVLTDPYPPVAVIAATRTQTAVSTQALQQRINAGGVAV